MGERSRLSQLPGTHTAAVAYPTIAGGTADTMVAWKNETGATVKITGAGFIPDTAITGAATNNMAAQFINKELGGAGTVTVTAVRTYASGTDAVAFVEEALVLSTTAANLLIDDGEVLAFDKTENGTGMALPAGVIILTYQFV